MLEQMSPSKALSQISTPS